MVQLTWVVNDTAGTSMRQEHGLSCWIETDDGHALLDTGSTSGVLLHNLRALGLDAGEIDALAISHAHDDHTGGLLGLLPYLRPGTPLFAHAALFEQRYSACSGTYVQRGIRVPPQTIAAQVDLRLDMLPRELLPGIWTTGEISSRPEPEGRSSHHYVWQDGMHVPDPYLDDMSLVLQLADGVFLLCGCCHAGLLNTIGHVQERWHHPLIGIAGGVHLGGATTETRERTAQALLDLPSLRYLWLGHCSGKAFMALMSERMPQRFRACKSGDTLLL
jgi:7,8-dihydropterin-6-yl-methyl-4-(beta-D-ribofuranosyl)aminobenzene 5'-phosphate synthase